MVIIRTILNCSGDTLSYDLGNDQEQQDILLGFVEEGREMLDEVEPLLIEIEQSADESGDLDLETINTVFRLFHSLKGGAGFLDLNTISGVTHEAETLLDMFRKGDGTLTSVHIDLMNRSCDFIRGLLDQIETEFHDHGFEEEAALITKELVKAIEGLKGEVDGEGEVDEEPESEENDESEDAEISLEPDPEPETKTAEKKAPVIDDLQMLISPEMVKQFTNEAGEQLEAAEEALLSLEKNPDDEEQVQIAFRAIHSFKGNAGFLGYSDMEKLSHSSENVLDRFREKTLVPNDKITNLILEIIDFLRNGLSNIENGLSPNIPATPGLVSLLKDYSGDEGKKEEKKAPVKKKEAKAAEPAPKEVKKQESKEKTENEEAVQEKTPVAKKPESVKKDISKPVAKKPATLRQSVRVDVEKLDVLLDLVGELVIAEAMVAQNPDLKGIDVSLERFERAAMQLNKITRDLQDIANSIRMIPLAGTFRRMVRLVRDLSQKASKKVDLKIVGEETEVDKTVIEQITDPLIHIIRNSLDHGLETPAEREGNGKNATGTLLLEAKYVGGEVWIMIEDDGRGLNRERILNRAIERELVTGDPNDIPDEQIWQFIFNPGFSTAEKITDVSGRGVGMDVVKRNIENTRGKVDIKSTEGKGTQVILRIPLTLAIIDGMLVRVGDERYTIPITAIRESLQIEKGMVTETMDGQEIIRVREELIPVVRLHSIFSVPTETTDLESGIITIVENDGNTVCLFLDEVLEQQQIVIKGMSDYIGNHECVSGCTILGDGDISLILDIAGIIDFARNNKQGAGDNLVKELPLEDSK